MPSEHIMTVVLEREELRPVRSYWAHPKLAKIGIWLADQWPRAVIAVGLALSVVWSVWLVWLGANVLGLV
jgi:hypothetical protein